MGDKWCVLLGVMDWLGWNIYLVGIVSWFVSDNENWLLFLEVLMRSNFKCMKILYMYMYVICVVNEFFFFYLRNLIIIFWVILVIYKSIFKLKEIDSSLLI